LTADAKKTKDLKKKLFLKEADSWAGLSDRQRKDCMRFAGQYMAFLDGAKTEREAVLELERIAGQREFATPDSNEEGDRLFFAYRGKNAAVVYRGRRPLVEGANIVVSHIDSPRLDLKQNPIYEEIGLALLKTHYYGGIKKFQWVSRPLALHGRVFTSEGKAVDVHIGEDPGDPVFTICDVLPHLARKVQYGKKIEDAVPGEKLNLLAGSISFSKEKTKDNVKLNVLDLLERKYGITEEDFVSAELEAVPAGVSRDVGLDRSMIGAYGHDDRSSVYASFRALTDMRKKPERTAVALFLDKEEIGSEGNTGAQGRFMLDLFGDLLEMEGEGSERSIRRALAASACLSADVNAGVEPDYQEAHELRNAARLGGGISITKFTGSRGKSGASDANAEFVARIRSLFNKHKIVWQAAELGKVDEGGGGTMGKFFAVYGMDVLDCGVPVLAMHSPFEVISKSDLFTAYRAFRAFFENL